MKTKLTNQLRTVSAALVLGGLALGTAGCVVHERGEYGHADYSHAGVAYADTGPYYDYYYYPDSRVYFYPQGNLYYWYQDGHWRSSHRLPSGYYLHEERRESVRSRSHTPWMDRYPGLNQKRRGLSSAPLLRYPLSVASTRRDQTS